MIETGDLSKQFDDFWAVDGVNLDVQPGEVLTLLGPNGAGKTTTIRMLTSVLSPTRGWAKIADYDVVCQPERVRSVVGVLAEQHGLYVRMSAEEYLDFFGQIYRLNSTARRKRSQYLLEYFGLAGAEQKTIGEFSKGMRQKLALARTLIHEPPVLLLDEPTSAMDPESARLVRDSIAGLRSENRAIIICTHNLTEAEMLADKIAIISQGKVIVSGDVEELKNRLLGPVEYEIQVNGNWPKVPLRLPEGVSMNGQGRLGPRFRVDDPAKSNPLLILELVASHIPIIAVQEVPRTLEQVYLTAMLQAGQETPP